MAFSKIDRVVVFFLALMPALYYLIGYLINPRMLGVDPIESLIHISGTWALVFLLITLSCSPFRRLGLKRLIRYRRMLGLYSFFYASVHMLVYVAGWISWDINLLLDDLIRRPFIYLGALCWLVLSLLAMTSANVIIKKLKKNWVRLHRLVYLAVILSWVHLWMQSRASYFDALVYGGIITVLLSERLYRAVHRRLAMT